MWLLETTVLDRLEIALRTIIDPVIEPTTAAHTGVLSTVDKGQVAVIKIEGILTKEPDPWISFLYGKNTAYDDIIGQLGMAEADANVKSIRLDIDSPGGNVDGLFDVFAALGVTTKPMSVLARNAHSAAFGIAAAAGSIVATGPGAQFGSIGTAVSMYVDDDVVTLTSTGAPEKRPDPRTEEGRASIIRHLDAIDDLFVDAIANGRGVSMDAVRQGFGRGASFLAGEAERRGMIDGIAGAGLRVVKERTQATADGGSEAMMDLEELKAQHPAVYKAAAAEGASQELDRVKAHLQWCEQSGAQETAFEAIRSGADITQELVAKYMLATISKTEIAARQADTDDADDAIEGLVTKDAATKDAFGEAVVSRLEELVGTQPVGV